MWYTCTWHMHVSVQMYMPMHVHAEARAGNRVLRQYLFTESGTCRFIKGGWLVSSANPPISAPEVEVIDIHIHAMAFIWVLGI